MTADVVAYAGRDEAWHRVGTKFAEGADISAEDALAVADADFQIDRVPTFYESRPGVMVATGRFSLVRREHKLMPEAYIGDVGESYEFVQNRDLARIADIIRGETGWRIETVGALGQGETVFITLQAGTAVIGGQEVKTYYLLNENRGNGRALRLAYTPVVVVCRNTLDAGLQSALVDVSMFHGKNFQAELTWRAGIVAKMKDATAETNKAIEALVTAKVADDQVAAILEQVYESPRESKARKQLDALETTGQLNGMDARMFVVLDEQLQRWQKAEKWAQETRDLVVRRYEDYNQHQAQDPRSRGTAFAVWMAVTETEDHRKGQKFEVGASLFGGGQARKAKAFTILSEFAKTGRVMRAAAVR